MKTKRYCTECDSMLEALTAITRQHFDACSKIAAVVGKEGRTDSPGLDLLRSKAKALMSECAASRQAFQNHRGSGHAIYSTFGG